LLEVFRAVAEAFLLVDAVLVEASGDVARGEVLLAGGFLGFAFHTLVG